MSDRNIYCYKCNRFVGIIRDAKLLKDLKHVCPTCASKSSAADFVDSLFGTVNRGPRK